MCGIAGFITGREPARQGEHEAALGRMAGALAHRGPDNETVRLVDGGDVTAGLAHRRLSIIDLSAAGNQPLANEDRTVWVVANGEIYNHVDIRKRLRAHGHVFTSDSDSEVIVHLYEEMGTDCVTQLSGMFAFAVFDATRGRLFLARDRVGIKPLYYARQGPDLFFASEIKALFAGSPLSREVDFRALDQYVAYGYVPGTRTVFGQVHKLAAGHLLVHENGTATVSPWWRIEPRPRVHLPEKLLVQELESRVEQAVSRHLVSDVPVGAFLSGGVDSSIVTLCQAAATDDPVRTFTLGYATGGKDERAHARAVARHLGTAHEEILAEPDIAGILPLLVWHCDEPFFDNSILPTWLVSRAAARSMKVVLSGDGGDELFGGYEWARRQQYHHYFARLPASARHVLDPWADPSSFEVDYGADMPARARRLVHDLAAPGLSGFFRRTCVSAAFRENLYTDFLRHAAGDPVEADARKAVAASFVVDDPRELMLLVDFSTYLPDDCLFKVDRMSMAHGLEVRVPLLDTDLVEFAARIPFSAKIQGFTSKAVLKKAFAGRLPKRVFRQRKQGFTLPMGRWLQQDLAAPVRVLLLGDRAAARNWFRPDFVRWMIEEHQAGRQNLGHRIWSLLVLEVWARLFLDERTDSAPDFSLLDMAS